MAAGTMMAMLKRWAPVAVSCVIMLLAVLSSIRTGRTQIDLPPLPAPVHVSEQRAIELDAETRAPLFSPSRSNAPIGADAKDAGAPPPTLTGIVAGGGRAVALVKNAKGETVMAHDGDTVDGWTVVAISERQIVVAHEGVQQTIALAFGNAKPETAAPATMGAQAHTSMAPASFDGLAAARRRGLPEANIPLGSPLAPSR